MEKEDWLEEKIRNTLRLGGLPWRRRAVGGKDWKYIGKRITRSLEKLPDVGGTITLPDYS